MMNGFFGFIRLRICITIAFIAASGFLLQNRPSTAIIPVVSVAFLIFAGGYAYNNMKDVKEDSFNRGGINPFSGSRAGLAVVSALFLAGIGFSAMLPLSAVAVALLMLAASVSYSALRIKQYTLLKNAYTGLSIPLAFLFGCFAGHAPPEGFVAYYSALSLFIFTGSMISDLRDIRGDERTGIGTLAVRMGFESAKLLSCALLAACALLMLMLPGMVILLPFALAALALVRMNMMSRAHSVGGASMIALAIWMAA